MSERSAAPLSPREWIGPQPFPWPPTLGSADGDDVRACFAILQLSTGRTRSGETFLRMQLADCYGTVEARLWDDADAMLPLLRPGAYIGVHGRIERYHEERQLRVEQLALLQVELDDLFLFLPRSARPAGQMDTELAARIDSISDSALRQLLVHMLGPDTDVGHAFRLAPAAKHNHHAYLGGLLEHTLSVARVCDMLAAHYGTAIDRDLLITGALLHDVGKIREIGARAGFPYTDEGKLLGHIVLGMQMVADAAAQVSALGAGRLLLLQHLIASHQGRFEWHSPSEPRTLEAILLHYADDLDAKLNQAGALINAVEHGWTAYDRSFGRDFLRHSHAAGAPPPEPEPRARPRPTPGPAAAAEPAPAAATEPAPAADTTPLAVLDTLDLFES